MISPATSPELPCDSRSSLPREARRFPARPQLRVRQRRQTDSEPAKGGRRTARRLGLRQLRIVGLRGGGGRAELSRLGEGLLQVRIVDVVDRRPKDRRRRNHVVPVPTAMPFQPWTSFQQPSISSLQDKLQWVGRAERRPDLVRREDIRLVRVPGTPHCLLARSASSRVRHIGFASHGSPLLANAVQSSCIFSDSTSSAGTVGPITASPITNAISPAW